MNSSQITQRLNEAIAHHKAGRLERAEAIYQQVAAAAPRLPVVFELWGQLFEQRGRPEEALRHYQQAHHLDVRSASVLNRLVQVLISLGRVGEAEKFLRRFLEKSPKSAEAWNALGFTLKIQDRISDALACHQKAVALNPKAVEGWVHYGLTLGVVGRNFLALQQFEKALALDPNYAPARYGRAETLQKVYRHAEALAEYDAYLRLVPGNLEAHSYRLFSLQNSDSMSREQLFAQHCAYGSRVGKGARQLTGYDLNLDRRLRVAILSPDLRTHSCAYFLEPLLRALNPAEFELFLYHDHFKVDAMSDRLKRYATQWRNFVGLSHASVEKTIRADKLDVLIDLTGHVGISVRLPILAKRLAPVQITYLGYPDTTGVPAIDFRLTDGIVDPVGEADAFATEKLVRFAPVAWTYQPPQDAPDVVPPPVVAAGAITFGCFNSPTKFTDSLYRAWAQILERVPQSRLLLKGGDFEEAQIREYLLGRMRACGVQIERVEMAARTDGTKEHLATYGRVDVALDTFPYNGTTTTCEALWMGRPVVTLRGNRHAARVGSSLLTCIGRSEWVAGSVDDYVRIAADLAGRPDRLQVETAALRDVLQRSPLLDHAGQGACFARALRECWKANVSETS